MPILEFNAIPFGMEDYPRVLASMTEPALLAEIRSRSMDGNFEHMREALKAGVFDAQPFIDEAKKNLLSANALQNAWQGRCSALMAIMENALVVEEEAPNGEKKKSLVFDVSEGCRKFLADFCVHVGHQGKAWFSGLAPRSTDDSTVAVTQAMHLTCMLDRADVLEGLIKARSGAVHVPMSDAKVGNLFSMFSTFMAQNDACLEIMPLFTAMQFSSEACVKTLLPHVGEELEMGRYGVGSTALTPLTFLASFENVTHMGSTAAMVPVMKEFLSFMEENDDGQKIRTSLLETIDEIMARSDYGTLSRNAQTIPACMQSGWLDVDPVRSINRALADGFPEVIDHFKSRIPWQEIFFLAGKGSANSPFLKAINNGNVTAVQSLLAMSKDEGKEATQAVVAHFLRQRSMPPDMATALTRRKAGISLLGSIFEMGIDGKTPVSGVGATLLDVAKTVDTTAASIIQSHMSRKKAHDLISEIVQSTKEPRPSITPP